MSVRARSAKGSGGGVALAAARRRPGLASAMRRAAGVAAAAALLASCAPTVPAPGAPDLAELAVRYERLRAARETRLAAVRMETTAWIAGEDLGRLPAVALDLALAGPDGVRARIGSLFGTALDLVVRGDSLAAWLPPRRIGVEVASLEDSLGVRLPGAWACRALGATWRPAGERWAWLEGGDSLMLAVGAAGLPAEVRLHAPSGRRLRVRYEAWSWYDGVAWPARCTLEEGEGAHRAELRLDRVQFLSRPDPRWMTLAIPAGAERLDWIGLRDVLSRFGGAP